MDILYFAWVRERIGTGAETLSPPPEATTVAHFLDWLATRSPGHTAALADRGAIRVALDQEFAPLDAPLGTATELAIFPPVTGG